MNAHLRACNAKKAEGFEYIPASRQLKSGPVRILIEHDQGKRYRIENKELYETGNGSERKLGRVMVECKSRHEAEVYRKFGNHFHWKTREHRLFTMQVEVLPEGIMRFAPGRNFEKVLVVDPQEYRAPAPVYGPAMKYEQVCRKRR